VAGRGVAPLERVLRPAYPLDLGLTLGPLRRGPGDPCHGTDASGALWRTCTTPDGPATSRLCRSADGTVHAAAWGPGARWALDGLPELLGAADDDTGFRARHGFLAAVQPRLRGLRLSRGRRVLDVLVPAVIEQKVTGSEARRSWRELTRQFGAPAPGPAPAGMRVPPTPAALLAVPDWDWHRCGIDSSRRRALRAAATVAGRLEECVDLAPAEARARLRAVPGIGPWTVAEVVQRATGCPDTVSVGDYNLPKTVGWALVGRPLDDAGFLEVLAPYAGQRQRAVRYVEASGFRKPRFAPRLAPTDYRRL